MIDRIRVLSSNSLLSTRPDLMILLEERNGLTLVRQNLCFASSIPGDQTDIDVIVLTFRW